MNVRDMYPKKYASGADLAGREVVVTISSVSKERMTPPNSPPAEKYVIHFRETKRGVVLSKTLAEQIAAATGFDDTDHWAGKTITLYPESIMVAGNRREVIRAKETRIERPLPMNKLTVNDKRELERTT